MATVTQTLVVVRTEEAVLAPPPVAIPKWAFQEGAGQAVGTGLVEGAYLRLPEGREAEIRARIDLLKTHFQDDEAEIQELMEKLNKAPPAIREEVKTWMAQFAAIPEDQLGDRVLSLGVFVCRVIRPTLGRGVSLAERDQLFDWEDACIAILGKTVGAESFLRWLEERLTGEAPFREACAQIDLIVRTQLSALRVAAQAVDAQIQHSCAMLKGQLETLQESRKELHQKVTTQVNALIRELDQVRVQILTEAEKIARLETDAPNPALERSLQECRRLLEGL